MVLFRRYTSADPCSDFLFQFLLLLLSVFHQSFCSFLSFMHLVLDLISCPFLLARFVTKVLNFILSRFVLYMHILRLITPRLSDTPSVFPPLLLYLIFVRSLGSDVLSTLAKVLTCLCCLCFLFLVSEFSCVSDPSIQYSPARLSRLIFLSLLFCIAFSFFWNPASLPSAPLVSSLGTCARASATCSVLTSPSSAALSYGRF